MNKMKKHVAIIGLGNISSYLCKRLIDSGAQVSGVTENVNRINNLSKIGVTVFKREEILKCIKSANSLIITAPPNSYSCPIISNFGKDIVKSNISWIGYLSSTSVYENHNGAEVTELTKVIPKEEPGIFRYKAEQDLKKLTINTSIKVEIFRVSGIYGLENNVFNQIKSGTINIIYKKGHFFNRIHVSDISRVLSIAAIYGKNEGLVNLSDDCPAPQIDIFKYAYNLINLKIPEVNDYRDIKNSLKPSIRRFWDNNRRVNNNLLNARYGPLIYPSYKKGLKNIYNLMTQTNNQ